MPQKTAAYLVVEHPDDRIPHYVDLVKEFSYSSDVMGVGELCQFVVVGDDQGGTLRKLREGAMLKLRLKNDAVNGGNWTRKHTGRIVERDVSVKEGTIKITSADLGWHLLNCHAPEWFRLRGSKLGDLLDPKARHQFLDPSFGFEGVRTGDDANALNRAIKLGKAGIRPPGVSPLEVMPVIQIEPGESFYDCITKYAQRFNKLINVSVDGYVQVWNPNYDRPPRYQIRCMPGDSNVIEARRHDDASTRYTQVTVVGEIVVPPIDERAPQPTNPNFNKRRGVYTAAKNPKNGLPAPLPFTHRQTVGDGEMFDRSMAAGQAEWKWKRGMFDSHYLQVVVQDHYQGDTWWESDEMVEVDIPALDVKGTYYIQSAACDSSTESGDTTTLILRWTHLLSASFGVWRNPPVYKAPGDKAAVTPGKGGGQ